MNIDIPILAQAVSVVAAATGVIYAVVTFRRTQKWQQLRFAIEVIEKINSDETLCLAIRFLDWHDREMVLPKRFAFYANEEGRFFHNVANMASAMSTQNRDFDRIMGVFDLKEEYRKPQYMIYVEVFDQFFDYLSQVHAFVKAGLIEDEYLTPIVYILRRLDALGLFCGYLEMYEVDDVLGLIARFKNASNKWVRDPAQGGA